MKVAIATLAGEDAIALLVAAWTGAGLAPERLHVVVDVRRTPMAGPSGERLRHLGTYRSLALWSPRSPADATRSIARAAVPASRRTPRHRWHRRRRRRALTLLARLIGDDEWIEWSMHERALALGHGLGIARLARDGADALAIARPLLACAHGAVRVVEID